MPSTHIGMTVEPIYIESGLLVHPAMIDVRICIESTFVLHRER